MSLAPAYQYINADELATRIKRSSSSQALKDIAVIDVRDDDFAGGNIVQAINSPSRNFHEDVTGLVERLSDVPTVVFRPKAARIYAETRNLLKPDIATQEILVLRDGFTGFQQRFRNDPELVEKFNKYYHDS